MSEWSSKLYRPLQYLVHRFRTAGLSVGLLQLFFIASLNIFTAECNQVAAIWFLELHVFNVVSSKDLNLKITTDCVGSLLQRLHGE